MSISELIKIFEKHRKLLNPNNKTIGSVLRYHREKQGHRLEDVSKDVCSLSYLCKVEKNKLIPSDVILRGVAKRLNLTMDEVIIKEKNTNYINEILKREYVPTSLYLEYQERVDAEALLIKYVFEILNKEDFKSAQELSIEIFKNYHYYNDDEMSFMLYALLKKNFLGERYMTVIELYKVIKVKYSNPLIYIRTMEITLKALYKLGLYKEAKEQYDSIYRHSFLYESYVDFNKLKHGLYYEKAKHFNMDEEIIEIEKINKNINIDLLKFNQQFYLNKDYNESLKYISKIKSDRDYYYMLYLLNLDKINNKEQLKKELYKENINFFKLSYKYICKYLKEKINGKPLSEDVIIELTHLDIITEDYYILSYAYNELINYYNNNFMYKKSTEISEKLIKLIKEKASIMLCHN